MDDTDYESLIEDLKRLLAETEKKCDVIKRGNVDRAESLRREVREYINFEITRLRNEFEYTKEMRILKEHQTLFTPQASLSSPPPLIQFKETSKTMPNKPSLKEEEQQQQKQEQGVDSANNSFTLAPEPAQQEKHSIVTTQPSPPLQQTAPEPQKEDDDDDDDDDDDFLNLNAAQPQTQQEKSAVTTTQSPLHQTTPQKEDNYDDDDDFLNLNAAQPQTQQEKYAITTTQSPLQQITPQKVDNYDDDDDDFLTLDTGNDKKDKNVFMASGLDFTADAYEELGIKNKEVTVCIEDSKGRVNKLVVRLSDNTEDAVRNFFRKHGPTKRFIDAQKEKLVHNDSTDRDLTLSFEIQGTGKRLATRPATLEKDILAFFKSNDMPDDVISSTVELVEAEKEKAIKSH